MIYVSFTSTVSSQCYKSYCGGTIGAQQKLIVVVAEVCALEHNVKTTQKVSLGG